MIDSRLDESEWDDDFDIDFDDPDIKPLTDEQKAFANEMRSLFQSFVDGEDLGEEFISGESLTRHFRKHCLADVEGRKSTSRNVYYDFRTERQYARYEERLRSRFRGSNGQHIFTFYDKDEVNKAFRALFRGNTYLMLSNECGITSGDRHVWVGIWAFSSDVTTNYKGGNTVDFCIMTQGPKTVTAYPLDASRLKAKLTSIINKYVDEPMGFSDDSTKIYEGSGTSIPRPDAREAKMTEYDKKIVKSVKSNGVYSLKKGWLKHPKRKDIPDVDMDAFDRLFAGWKARYDGLTGKADSSDDVTEFIEDLYDLRKKSIAEEGEYGLGNLVFKEFRNRGYLDRLRELRNELKSRELSLEGLHHASKQG